MVTTNGFLTSDDELLLDEVATEPAAYEFQSDLTDEDAPDPLTLDEIATASLAVAGTLDPPTSKIEPRPASEAQENGIVKEAKATSAGGARPVGIEVHLPWLSPAQRGEYQYIEVDEFSQHGYHRPRRSRYKVRHVFDGPWSVFQVVRKSARRSALLGV